jgi:tetratricopeptide (TPR) repeat protein
MVMAPAKPKASQPTQTYWRPAQAYVLATVTLLLGIAVGYLLRGSEPGSPPATAAAPAPAPTTSAPSNPVAAPPAQNASVEPLLRELQARPNDPALLTQIGNTYYDNRDYGKALPYYERSLKARPEDVNVRTDMGTAMWYMGNADGAIQQFDRSLQYQPTHAQTLFNLGIVKWQGKKDAKGALQAWEKLLASNPNYPERQKVQDLMQQAKSGSQ